MDQILEFVCSFPGRDDDQISAALNIKPRQAVNQACRKLADMGKVERRPGLSGKIGNFPLCVANTSYVEPVSKPAASATETTISDVTKEWFWEGNVSDTLAHYLVEQGWQILSQADTRSKERGVDVHARFGHREVMVEVKGYPSEMYRREGLSGQKKRTPSTLQAGHWYSHALLKVMRLQSAHPTTTVAMAFPDFPRYRSLFNETERGLRQLGVAVLFVSETGKVEAFGF